MSDDIPVSPNFEPVPGVNYGDEPAVAPEAPKEPEPQPEQPVKPAEAPAEEPKADPEPKEPEQPRDPEGRFTRKPKPIANLLEKKHEAEQRAEAVEAENKQLKEQLAKLSQQPSSQQSDDDIKALAEEFGIDETMLAKIVNTARKGFSTELPKEVQDLLAERQAEKQQAEELAAFDTRLNSLSKTFKDEPCSLCSQFRKTLNPRM
jgi:hypothetical protein